VWLGGRVFVWNYSAALAASVCGQHAGGRSPPTRGTKGGDSRARRLPHAAAHVSKCARRERKRPKDPQAETTGNRLQIAEDVPVLWVDYLAVKSTLPGVWWVPYSGEYDPEIERRLSPQSTRL
jgi:hypothetical protein